MLSGTISPVGVPTSEVGVCVTSSVTSGVFSPVAVAVAVAVGVSVGVGVGNKSSIIADGDG